MDPDAARARARRDLVWACVGVNLAVFALSRPAMMRHGLHDLIGVVFLGAAMAAVHYDDDDTARYGIRLEGVFPGRAGDPRSLVRTILEGVPSALRETGVAGAVALVVLPVYTALWPYFNRPVGPRHFTLDAARWREILTELLAVAFTEEMFFRGYVFTRLADALGVPVNKLSGTTRPDWKCAAQVVALSSLLFAVTHVVVEPTVARAVVFFPGLLFGALRVWRGGIGAAVVLHATSNLWERYLEGR